MIFGSQELDDRKTVGFYDIQHMSVLYVILSIKGGGGMMTFTIYQLINVNIFY